jgi:hypothetical protein
VTCAVHDLIIHSDAPTVDQIRKYDERVERDQNTAATFTGALNRDKPEPLYPIYPSILQLPSVS